MFKCRYYNTLFKIHFIFSVNVDKTFIFKNTWFKVGSQNIYGVKSTQNMSMFGCTMSNCCRFYYVT